ncbi:hypothetical protein ACYSNR_13915 [Enterococcus sp. LJL128]|uniref:hypothetical protein n=1 Tax=Enterococcus sp. LJL51 TaxID=3416656 RepID=UPI003CF16625
MNNYLYYRNFVVTIATFIVLIFLSVKYFRGGVLFTPERAVSSTKDFVSKYGRIMTTGVYLVFLVLCLVVLSGGVNLIKDLPYVLEKKYIAISGPAVNQSTGKETNKVRAIKIKDDKTGEIIHVSFYGDKTIHKGDFLELYYYPNSHIGAYQNSED